METEKLTLAATAERLKAAEDILLLMHQFPDGDTIGCASRCVRSANGRALPATIPFRRNIGI